MQSEQAPLHDAVMTGLLILQDSPACPGLQDVHACRSAGSVSLIFQPKGCLLLACMQRNQNPYTQQGGHSQLLCGSTLLTSQAESCLRWHIQPEKISTALVAGGNLLCAWLDTCSCAERSKQALKSSEQTAVLVIYMRTKCWSHK
jgi:hypothetical protein